MSPLTSFVNDGHGGVHHNLHHESSITGTRSGQILWIRGLTRLQTQVGPRKRPSMRPCSLAFYLFVVRFVIIGSVVPFRSSQR